VTFLAASATTTLWYMTRATGVVALLLLTTSLALGIANWRRVSSPRWPRFVIDAVHRNVSLLVMAFLAVHIVTTLIDGYAPVAVLDVFVPFGSAYRPLWLGLGAVALDMLLAVMITSLLRRHFGHRAWRLTHWLAYVCWPVALVHSLGAGSDVQSTWLLAIDAACLVVVIGAIWWRATLSWERRPGIRTAVFAGTLIGPLALIAWLPSGPLGKGWARRAGTPSRLLASAASAAPSSTSTGARRGASATGATSSLDAPFQANVTGTVRQAIVSSGLAAVKVSLRLSGGEDRRLRLRIEGQPSQGGGVAMTSSAVTLGTRANPALYRGRIVSLQGTSIGAVATRGDGHSLTLQLNLSLDAASGVASGTVAGQPASGGSR